MRLCHVCVTCALCYAAALRLPAQHAHFLPSPQGNLFVVGDPDQSIYEWRGADMDNMTCQLKIDYPDIQVCMYVWAL